MPAQQFFHRCTITGETALDALAAVSSLPKQRLIAPEEIANLVVFLASAYSAPLHGAVLDASMGLGVRPGLMSEYDGH